MRFLHTLTFRSESSARPIRLLIQPTSQEVGTAVGDQTHLATYTSQVHQHVVSEPDVIVYHSSLSTGQIASATPNMEMIADL